MPNGPNNNLPPDLSAIASAQNSRLYQRERKRIALPVSSGAGAEDLAGNANIGVIQDGHSFVFDEGAGLARPSAPQLVPFSWPGVVVTGAPSGPHLVVLPNPSRLYLVTLAIGTVDPDAEITVEFILNGTGWTSLTLATSEQSTLARYNSSWPSLGGNATDIIQVQCTACGSTGSDLVAAVRII